MSTVIQLLIVLVLGAIFLAATAAIWAQRSPRRATLSTLKVATAPAKSSAPARGAAGIVPPVAETPGSGRRSSKLEGVASSVVDGIALLARRLSPPGYLASVQHRLALAGKGRTQDADRFLALRLVSLFLIVPAFLLLSFAALPGLYRLLAFFLLASLLGLGPEAGLNRAVAERQDNIRRDLPILVELLMISVEAGLGFDQALARSLGSVPGPLGEEFSRYLGRSGWVRTIGKPSKLSTAVPTWTSCAHSLWRWSRQRRSARQSVPSCAPRHKRRGSRNASRYRRRRKRHP